MTAVAETSLTYRLGEFHSFEAKGQNFLYLVPAGAIFQVDEAVGALIDCFAAGPAPHDRLLADLIARGMEAGDAEEFVLEMLHSSVIVTGTV